MKKILLSTISAIILCIPTIFVSTVTYAVDQTTKDTACSAIPGGCSSTPANSIQSNVQFALDIFSWIVGIAAVIMLIMGGFRFVTSGGDSGRVSAARNTILYAVIGLVVVMAAQIVVKFVLGNTNK